MKNINKKGKKEIYVRGWIYSLDQFAQLTMDMPNVILYSTNIFYYYVSVNNNKKQEIAPIEKRFKGEKVTT